MSRYNRSPPNIENMVSLKVDNLSYQTTADELKRYFSRYGEIGDVYIPKNPITMTSRGFAFVRYYSDREAEKAIDSLDGKNIDGREIRICHAKYNRPAASERRRSPERRRRRSTSKSRSRSRRRSKSRSRRRSSRSKSRSRSNRKSRSRSNRRSSRRRSSRSRTRSRSSKSSRRSSRSRSKSR